jgi:hypothetical protein
MQMWTNLFEMIADVRKHIQNTGQSVETADDPMIRAMGYRSKDREWFIKLTDVRMSSLPPLNQEQHMIVERFRTPDGRKAILGA